MTSFDVTRRALSLGARLAWSGHRTKSFATSTIEMQIIPRGASLIVVMAGVYPITDAVGRTADPVNVGDQILDSANVYWDIETVEPFYWGDSFSYRRCNLNKAIMYQADPAATTWTKSRGSDSRYRTKVWMDAKLRAAQITKDDDSAQADFAVMHNNPPYPIELEFRGSSNMEGLFVIDQPNAEPLRDGDQIIRDYAESVPIHILTVDSTACTGSALAWKMEAELRYICQEYPEGSQRNLSAPRRKANVNLGGMILYDTEVILSYTRDKDT